MVVRTIRQNLHPAYHHIISRDVKGWNEVGFRIEPQQRNFTKDKKEGVYRIIMLGDSFVYGMGVRSYSETIPYYLEECLNRASLTRRFEVLSFGIFSYSPIIHYLTLKNIGLKLNPDMILCLYDDSDAQDDVLYSRCARRDGAGELIGVFNPDCERKGIFSIIQKTALYKYLRFKQKKILLMRDPYINRKVNRYGHFRDGYERWKGYFDISFGYLYDTFNLTNKKGIPFVVFNYPYPYMLEEKEKFKRWLEGFGFDYTKDYKKKKVLSKALSSFCQKNKIPFYDLTDSILELEESGYEAADLYDANNGHFNSRGNKLIAEEIGKIIRRQVSLTGTGSVR